MDMGSVLHGGRAFSDIKSGERAIMNEMGEFVMDSVAWQYQAQHQHKRAFGMAQTGRGSAGVATRCLAISARSSVKQANSSRHFYWRAYRLLQTSRQEKTCAKALANGSVAIAGRKGVASMLALASASRKKARASGGRNQNA